MHFNFLTDLDYFRLNDFVQILSFLLDVVSPYLSLLYVVSFDSSIKYYDALM